MLSQVAIGMEYRYDGLLEPVTFTGVLLLGAERIDRVWLRSFCPPNCNYLKVRQVRFDEGRVIGDMDRSQEVEDLRSEFSDDSELSLAELLLRAGSQ